MDALRNSEQTDITSDDRSATASDLSFARRDPSPGAWRRALTLAKRAYGPLLIYAALRIFLIAAIAIRVSIWVPMLWR